MTRDEAIEKFGSVGGSSFASSAWIDRFVAIGILKLEEPKTLEAQLAIALGWPEDGRSHGELIAALKISGLKLTPA